MQAASGQMSLMAKREPLAQVIAKPDTPESTRRRLQLLSEAREFASKELGLPDNGSYRSYVALRGDFVVWNVFATPRFSIEPKQWCFPVAGCVVYRGYFNERAAQRYARGIRLSGGDATVAGATAYSTLGHFDDPILSTMLRYDDLSVIGTLFHELAHQVAYAPGDSVFNESFATAVEDEGVARWLAASRTQTQLRDWEAAKIRERQFTALLLAARERLRALYANDVPQAELEHRKQLEFGRLKFEYWQLQDSWNGYAGYDAWFDRALNNADLAPVATYDSCAPAFKDLLREMNDDLPGFYERVRALTKNNADRAAFCGRR